MSDPLKNPLRGLDPSYDPFVKRAPDTSRSPRRSENDNTSTQDSTGISGKAHAVVSISANQAIASGAFTTIAFDNFIEDNVGLWVSTANTKFTIPTWGYPTRTHWLIHAQIRWAASAAGNVRGIRILKNGTTSVVSSQINAPANAVVTPANDIMGIIHAPNPGDFFEIQALQDTGGNLNLIPVGGDLFGSTFMEILTIW